MTASPVWHPFTQHATSPPPIPVARTHGAYLETPDGRQILDAISSWWVITHGHRYPPIMAAIRETSEALDQVIFAGFTHSPAEDVAARLVALTWPLAQEGEEPLTRVFFSDSGSTAVEVALKMALGYWRNIGETRTRIIALEHAYHGDTIGTMSAGARGIFNAAYEPLLFDVARLPFPVAGHEQVTLDVLEVLLCEQPTAAVIVEPLILGAGGMLVYAPSALAGIRALAGRHGALFIADEVMTGFGRTGTAFACEQAGIAPDILCLAKGITGGAVPLAATLATERIFQAHYSHDRARTFFHSSSYTANPIACAAAKANLDVWAHEPVLERIRQLSRLQTQLLAEIAHHPLVRRPRALGTITAFDIETVDPGYLASIGPRLYEVFLSENILLRPLGNTVYVMPPYCTTETELARVYDVILRAVGTLA
jgi:adenosylmethionine-8-amino-7-oxononanoate aminotransferase